MSENTKRSDELVPEPAIRPSRRSRPSLVWAVPAVAGMVALGLVAQTMAERGPRVEVTFNTAQGIEPGKTKVRFRDVEIGQVSKVTIAPDRKHVVTTIDLSKEARDFASENTRFWVVRPRLAGTAISGLETVLSGAYIGVDGGQSGASARKFTGLEEPPVVASDVPGHRYRLRADDIGSLDIGSPIYYRRIQVGHVESYALEPDGQHIQLGMFIKAPYDHFITADSRFWHASGVDLHLDANGLKVETQSLATMLMGGVAFESPGLGPDGAEKIPDDGVTFTLSATRAEAMKTPDGEPLTMVLRFRQTIRGLEVGAPVDFRGVEIGQVRSVGIEYDPTAKEYVAPVVVDIYPERLRIKDPEYSFLKPAKKNRDHGAVLSELVQRGLRGQLASGSLLTGAKIIALDFHPEAPPVKIDPKADPLVLPTIPSELEELQMQIQGILHKLNDVPLKQLSADLHQTLTSLDGSLRRMESLEKHADTEVLPEIRDGLRDMRQSVEQMRQSMEPDAPLQQDSRAALQNMTEVARSLKTLSDSLNRHPESLLRGKPGDAQ